MYSAYKIANFNPELLFLLAAKISEDLNKRNSCLKPTEKIGYIAVCGSSGMIMGGAISAFTKIPLILVRKEFETSHGMEVEYLDGQRYPKNYVIVDDCIASAATVKRIKEKIDAKTAGLTCAGIYLYWTSQKSWISELAEFKGLPIVCVREFLKSNGYGKCENPACKFSEKVFEDLFMCPKCGHTMIIKEK